MRRRCSCVLCSAPRTYLLRPASSTAAFHWLELHPSLHPWWHAPADHRLAFDGKLFKSHDELYINLSGLASDAICCEPDPFRLWLLSTSRGGGRA
ncbi:hypothetical protein D1007_50918 [Hordeum vulgare]|nr:hypothetical protein D1007_50918 [Hordeum vulgare]